MLNTFFICATIVACIAIICYTIHSCRLCDYDTVSDQIRKFECNNNSIIFELRSMLEEMQTDIEEIRTNTSKD